MNINTRFSTGQRVRVESVGDGIIERIYVDIIGLKEPLISYEVRFDNRDKQLLFDSDLELINCSHHELKCWPGYFQDISRGLKTFEIRHNDRNFKSGDILYLREWSPDSREYSGRSLRRIVTYTLTGFGVRDGFIAMGIEPI